MFRGLLDLVELLRRVSVGWVKDLLLLQKDGQARIKLLKPLLLPLRTPAMPQDFLWSNIWVVQSFSKHLSFLLACTLSFPLRIDHLATFLYVLFGYDQAASCALHVLRVGLITHGFWLMLEGSLDRYHWWLQLEFVQSRVIWLLCENPLTRAFEHQGTVWSFLSWSLHRRWLIFAQLYATRLLIHGRLNQVARWPLRLIL